MTSTERRRAPRAPASFAVQFTSGTQGQQAVLKDISEIGLCCLSPDEVPEMTAVRIDLELPERPGPHTVEGAVVRCEPADPEPDGYEVAVYFTAIPEHTKKALREFVQATLMA